MNVHRSNAHRSIVLAVTLAGSLSVAGMHAACAQEAEAPPRQHWSFHGPFGTYDDHRMVMAAAVLGLGVPGIEVLNVATVGKTFPGFTTLWESLVRGDVS